MDKLLDPRGRQEFIQDLQKKVLTGYGKLTGQDLGQGSLKPVEEKKLKSVVHIQVKGLVSDPETHSC